jgi:hypothetical protein
MDPYIEDRGSWQGFHARFLTYWCDMIADVLPDAYYVDIEEGVLLGGGSEAEPRRVQPDLLVSREERPSGKFLQAPAVAMSEPVEIGWPLPDVDEPDHRYLQILKFPERSVVTVLELLSPTNKRDPGRAVYCAKRNAYRQQGVHLFELDLLLGGQRLPMRKPLPPGDYYTLISRGDQPASKVYAWTVRDPLPTLPIPLRAPDPDIWFDLGALFATTYERGRYERRLSYGEPLELPLREEDRSWVMEQGRTQDV